MRVFFIDTETAVSQPEDCTIQLAIKEMGRPGKSYEMRPRFPIKPAGLAVHGISNKTASSYPNPKEALSLFVNEYAALSDPDSIAVGWNVQFDYDHIQAELKSAGLNMQFKTADLMVSAKRMIPVEQIGNHKMDTVYCYFFENDQSALDAFFAKRASHDALFDVELTEGLFEMLMRQDGGSIEGFLAKLDKPVLLTEFPFGKYKGRSFLDVIKIDRGYVNWVCRQDFVAEPKNRDLVFTLRHYGLSVVV